MDTRLSIIVDAQDKASATLTGITGRLKDMQPAFKTMAVAGTAAFGVLAAASYKGIQASMEHEAAVSRLTQILKTSRGATEDQIEVLLKQAKALEKVGVVGEEAILVAQGQLATFDLETKSINQLIPSLLNYAVAEKGANVTTEELQQMTNGLAQALNGNFGSLTRSGFVLDENTKAMIENGTETERITALVKVLDSTYAGFNETARGTAEGGMFAFKTAVGDIEKALGNALIPAFTQLLQAVQPIIERFATWAEQNPELLAKIVLVAGGIAALVAIVGTLGLLLPAIIAGVGALGTAFMFLALNPIGLVITGLALVLLNFKTITDFIADRIVWIMEKVKGVQNAVGGVVDKAKGIGSNILDSIGSGLNAIGVHDAIIAPGGKIITTDPQDYIIATKTPGSLGGGATYNFHFNEVVAGDDGIKRIISETLQKLDRNSMLKGYAGA